MFLNDTTLDNLDGRLFGYHIDDNTPRPGQFRGMRGWFTVPRGWNVRWGNGQYEASPNQDFSTPLYQCEVADDGALVFQDMMLGTAHRDIGSNGIPTPQSW